MGELPKKRTRTEIQGLWTCKEFQIRNQETKDIV